MRRDFYSEKARYRWLPPAFSRPRIDDSRSPRRTKIRTLAGRYRIKRQRERFIHPDNTRGILKISPRGRIQFTGHRAMRCLKTFLGPCPKKRPLPETVLRWIERETEAPGCWEKDGRRLTLTFLDRSRKGSRYYLIEEGPATGPRLTAQERQVLDWVMLGKSNAQIALILEVKLCTVKKHLQNAFEKLGVDNRTAAACSLYDREETGPRALDVRASVAATDRAEP